MTNDPHNPEPGSELLSSGHRSSAGSTPGETGIGIDDGGQAAPTRVRPAWVPSPRLTAALAGVMLAAGVAIGAAIGPAPEASLAGAARLPLLLPSLIARASAGSTGTSTAGTQPPPISETATPRVRRHRKRKRGSSASSTTAATEPSSSTETSGSSGSKAKGNGNGAKTVPLPAITKVWVLELAGSTFAEALAAPTTAPYINSTAIPLGTLLSGWSALQASAFASDAALIATTEPQLAETILQPPCPEGPAGAPCAPGTPGALKTADEFLAQTLPAITSSAAYRTNGLIVVTFGSIAAGASSGLPAGSTTATLSSLPAAGALLISPFVNAGKRPSTTFNPSSPKQSLEALLHR